MAELEGTKTVVVGGKKDVKQQYCGTVGGQSTDFATIDSEIKACSKSDSADEWMCRESLQLTLSFVFRRPQA